MQRPKLLTLLACFHLYLGVSHLLMAIPASRMQETYMLYGHLVGASTYMYFLAMVGVAWLYVAYSVFQGLHLGITIYLGLKASHWGVTLLGGLWTSGTWLAFVFDLAILGLLWKYRDWFRN